MKIFRIPTILKFISSGIMEEYKISPFINFNEVYKDYYNGYMMTLNDPLSREEFMKKASSDERFAKRWGLKVNEVDFYENKNILDL